MNTIFNSITVVFALAGTATGGTAAADTDGKPRKDPHWRDDPSGMADLDDAAVTAAIRSKLAGARGTDDLTTYVEARHGRVTLLGTVQSTAASRRTESMAQDTPGVAYVDNQLIVTDSTPYQVEIAPLTPMAFTEPTGAEMTAGFVPPIQITPPAPYGTATRATAPTDFASVHRGRTDAINPAAATRWKRVRGWARMDPGASNGVPASVPGGPEISVVRGDGGNLAMPGRGADGALAR